MKFGKIKDKISFWYKYNFKKHHTICILLILALIILSSIWLYSTTSKSLDKKNEQIVAHVNNINTIVGNISVLNTTSEAIQSWGFYTTSLDTANEYIANNQLPDTSFIENILHPSKSNDFNRLMDEVTAFSNETEVRIRALKYGFETIKKFLDYSPAEDFSQYGIDQANDSERISRATQAFEALINDNQLSSEIQNAVAPSKNSLATINTVETVPVYIETVTDSQKTIVVVLSNDINQLKSDVNDFYNSILYQ